MSSCATSRTSPGAQQRALPSRRATAVQSSFVLLFASAIIAAPALGQSQPPSNSSTKATRADSLGTPAKKSAAKKAQPAKTSKASATTKPGRKTWTGGRNGFVVDSAEAASLWPVKGPAPSPGAVVPAKRIIAYYGNPLVKKMGILGELPPDQMLAKLDTEVERWRKADPGTPVQPALHVIGVVAQGSAGRDGMWRSRMSDSLIERVYGWAQKKNALLFIDVQVGHSTLQAELPRLAKFLERPDVHLGIDPEFSMKGGEKPGTKIGRRSGGSTPPTSTTRRSSCPSSWRRRICRRRCSSCTASLGRCSRIRRTSVSILACRS
jgi:hypothetical protein